MTGCKLTGVVIGGTLTRVITTLAGIITTLAGIITTAKLAGVVTAAKLAGVVTAAKPTDIIIGGELAGVVTGGKLTGVVAGGAGITDDLEELVAGTSRELHPTSEVGVMNKIVPVNCKI